MRPLREAHRRLPQGPSRLGCGRPARRIAVTDRPGIKEAPPLVSDEQLQAVTVGERKPHNAPVTLVDYDPTWPALFDREAARIRGALGATVVRLEHTGSTSVPGLAAKPVIDITLIVPDSADEPAYVPALEAAGYVMRIREPDWHEHRVFKGPDTDVNLHVFSSGSQ